VAQRDSRSDFLNAIGDFERAFDALFDDLLISRWRCIGHAAAHTPEVIDHGDRYEVRITPPPGDPTKLEIEASDRRLVLRDKEKSQAGERIVTFHHMVEADAATARIDEGCLIITLPKRRPRKIQVS
jgi:HSP20 family molecular chaperone IbpA